MKTLTEYYKNGHDFKLLKREGNLAIFQGQSRSGNHGTFEVVRIKFNPAGKFLRGGVEVETKDSETPPPDSAWGSLGWTASTLEQADAIFARELALKPSSTPHETKEG